MKLLNYEINTELPTVSLEDRLIVNTINPHSYCVAKKDEIFSQALHRSDVLLPDGAGIVLSAKVLQGKTIHRITGSDLHLHLLDLAQTNMLRVFYLGASNETLSAIRQKVALEYPAVEIDVFSPPFKSEFSADDNREMVSHINAFKPHILFVGMTAPKQEKWVYRNEKEIDANLICSIGAVFDFYTGRIKRPGKYWQRLGLEWLPRLVREPKRLFRRNFISTPHFLWDVMVEKIKMTLKG
ncbi:MAG: glycosyltransferase [Paludibacter sp. 47-17]|nr:MAG: glycosyltransferase [Paludibacter sp. 47-17]